MAEAGATTSNGTILMWNFANWTTVVLMAMIAFGGIALAQKWYQNRNASA